MAQPISLESFMRSLLEGNILSRTVIEAHLDNFVKEDSLLDSDKVAKLFLDERLLTTYQAGILLHGDASSLRIGQYTVLDRIGAGGMGTVYKAKHRKMNRVVAIKTLTSDASRKATFRSRFEREVQMIAQLNHPNIVMAYDAGEWADAPFLVMEFIKGRDLATEVEQDGPLSIVEAVLTTLQAARGLGSAHANGLVHRDVKPANFLRDHSGVVKVADLGIACVPDAEIDDAFESLTVAGNFLGSAAYAAPEQALDASSVDLRADIYGLGCTLFYLLTGRPPYHSTSLLGLLLKHRDASIPLIREFRPDASYGLDAIFAKMTAKKVENRPGSMAEVIVSLEDLLKSIDLTNAIPPQTWASDSAGVRASLTQLFEPEGMNQETSASDDVQEGCDTTEQVAKVDFTQLAVVMVEPSRFQAKIIRNFLKELGVKSIRTAQTGHEAMSLLDAAKTDILLSAMFLDDMDGLQLAQELHKNPKHQGVGLVLAASDTDHGDVVHTIETTQARLLAKPFNVSKLAETLTQALRDRRKVD